jgi:hypothetical protein
MKKLILHSTLALVLVLGSCSDITDLNEDPKGPTEVPAETLFSNAQMSIGTFLNEENVNINIFKYIAQYWAATDYPSESRYDITTRAIPSNIWSELYRDVLADLQQARTLIEEEEMIDEPVRQNQLASIEVIAVLTYATLVDIFGDIPYSEALDSDNTQPVFDNDETVYLDLIDRLNVAISNFDPNAESFGTADIFYGGNVDNWIAFANSLKMRLGIMLADSNPQVAQTAVEEADPAAFTSNEQNAEIPFDAAPPHTSPIWENLVQSGRDDYVPANTIVDTMNALDDPRRPQLFTQVSGEYIGGIYGDPAGNDFGSFSHMSDRTLAEDFPGMVLGYEEVAFIRAEAAARGWNVTGTAAENFEEGIRADMQWWEVPEGDIDTYVAAQAYDAGGDFREQIGLQKWLAFYLQGIRGWTVWRRLDNPTLNPPPGFTVDDIPLRFTYPVDEQNLNQSNYSEAASNIGGDELSTPIFWDVQ